MLVIADALYELVARLLRGSLRTEEAAAHIVVDSDHAKSFPGKMLDGFRTDQACGTSDDDFAHVRNVKRESCRILRLAQEPGECTVFRLNSRGRKLFVTLNYFFKERDVLVC